MLSVPCYFEEAACLVEKTHHISLYLNFHANHYFPTEKLNIVNTSRKAQNDL